jgi:hypothetical protein
VPASKTSEAQQIIGPKQTKMQGNARLKRVSRNLKALKAGTNTESGTSLCQRRHSLAAGFDNNGARQKISTSRCGKMPMAKKKTFILPRIRRKARELSFG